MRSHLFKVLLTLVVLTTFLGGLSLPFTRAESEEKNSKDSVKSAEFSINYPYDTSIVRSRDYLKFDDQLSETLLDQYKIPKKIYVIYVSAPTKDVQSDGEEWVKGLYYYSITKLHFPDVPFNFVVTHDGFAYAGKYGALDVQPFLTGAEAGAGSILIAYLGYGGNYDIDYAGKEKLKEVLGYVSGFYGISTGNIVAMDWSVEKSSDATEASAIVLSKIDSSHRWASQVNNIKSSGLRQIPKVARTYSAEKLQVVSDEQVEIGKKLQVVARYRNTGNFPWYKNAADQLVLYVKDKKKSEFAINKEWLGAEAVTSITSDWVIPQEVGQFTFNLATPFVPDEFSESFELRPLNGGVISGSGFTVTFTTTGGDNEIVEILETGYGYLNLRQEPSYYSKVIGTVTPGKKYLLVQKGDAYYKIRTNDGTEGWVNKKYAKIVQ